MIPNISVEVSQERTEFTKLSKLQYEIPKNKQRLTYSERQISTLSIK